LKKVKNPISNDVKNPISNDVKNNVMSIYDKRVLKSFIEFNLVELKYH